MMITLGILGVGRMGLLHLRNASSLKTAKVVAVADKNARNLAKAKDYGVRTYSEFTDLLDTEELDAVIISLPNTLKEKSVLHSIEKNLDIFIDKPFARNFDEAQRIVHKIRAKGARLMVGSNCRYFDSVQSLTQHVADGRIGEIVLVTSDLVINGPFSHPREPHPVPSWYLSASAGGGALLDLGYHLIDLFTWHFGDSKLLHASLGHRYGLQVEDSGTIILQSKETLTKTTINVGWFCKQIFPAYNFHVGMYGTAGYASTDHFTPRNMYLHAAQEGMRNIFRRLTFRPIRYLTYTYYYSSYHRVLDAFIQSLITDTMFPVDLSSQLEVMRIIDKAYETDCSTNDDEDSTY